VDIGLQLLEALLVADAEVLLLVDDQQAQVLEVHVLGEQRMGADHDIDLAAVDAFLGGLGLLCRDETGKLGNPHGQAGKTRLEGRVVLARPQGRRHDHGDLIARHHRHEGRTQRNLGLAETDVAADQTVHGPARAQVLDDLLDRLFLIVGLLIGEAGAELVVETGHQAHLGTGLQLALGGDLEQFAGHLGDAVLQAGAARLPACAAQLVEMQVAFGRAVARQQLQVFDRHEQLVAIGINQPQAVVWRLAQHQGLQAVEAADAVFDMNHQVALGKLGGLGEETFGIPLGALARGPRDAVAQDVLLGDDGKIERLETPFELQNRRSDRAGGQFLGIGPGLDRGGFMGAVLLEQAHQPVAAAAGQAGEQDALVLLLAPGDVAGDLIEQVDIAALAFGREVVAGPPPGFQHDGIARGGLGEGREFHLQRIGKEVFPGQFRQIEPLGRHRPVGRRFVLEMAGAILTAMVVVVADGLQAGVAGVAYTVIKHHDGVAEIGGNRLQPVVEQRQPVLQAGDAIAGTRRLIDRIVALRGAEQVPPAAAEAGDGILVQQNLAGRRQQRAVALAAGTLGQRIEGADLLHLVAEQVQAIGLLGARWEDVDDVAAHGEISRLHHSANPVIAGPGQETRQFLGCHMVAGFQGAAQVGKGLVRRHALQQGARRGQHHHRIFAGRARSQSRQGRETCPGNRRIGRDTVVGQAVPGRELHDMGLGSKEAQGIGKALGPFGIACNHQDVAGARFRGQCREHRRIDAFGGAANDISAIFLDSFKYIFQGFIAFYESSRSSRQCRSSDARAPRGGHQPRRGYRDRAG
jgi:hypothetical protein